MQARGRRPDAAPRRPHALGRAARPVRSWSPAPLRSARRPSSRLLAGPEAGWIYFGLSKNGAYDAADRGEIPYILVGRLKRVSIARICACAGAWRCCADAFWAGRAFLTGVSTGCVGGATMLTPSSISRSRTRSKTQKGVRASCRNISLPVNLTTDPHSAQGATNTSPSPPPACARGCRCSRCPRARRRRRPRRGSHQNQVGLERRAFSFVWSSPVRPPTTAPTSITAAS